MSTRRTKDDGRKEMPRSPQVGDRVKLKEGSIQSVTAACTLAGYDFDPKAILTVTRADPFAPDGGRRLFFDQPPHCFVSTQVELAWNSKDERRAALRAQDWKV